jgi:hypothetical protein
MGKTRKRAPGGGRKPDPETGGKTATFTTRITRETRRELDRAAQASGLSVSNVAELRLRASFDRPVGPLRNYALGWAVATLANRVEEKTGRSWREDLFTGTALRHAVEMLLTLYAPEFVPDPEIPPAIEQAAAKMPPDFADQQRKPAGFGHSVAYNLHNEIEQARAQLAPVRSTDPKEAAKEWSDRFNEWSMPMFGDQPEGSQARGETLARIARDLSSTEARKGTRPR